MPLPANWIQKNMGALSAALTVTAPILAAATYQFDFGFVPTRFLVQTRTSTGDIRVMGAGDLFVITGTGVLLTFGGGASPDIQVNDVVTILAWS